MPGLQSQVAVYPGELDIKEAAVYGASMDYAGYEETGQVYIVQLTPNAESVTVILGPETYEEPVAIKGDVNGDGRVDPDDAILVLRVSVGIVEPTEAQVLAADMNGDGAVESDDAILILRAAIGLLAPDVNVAASANRNISVSLPEAHGVSGEIIAVPVTVDNNQMLSGGDISLSYDHEVLRLIDISSDADAIMLTNIERPGTARIAFVAGSNMKSKNIAQMRFEVITDEISPLAFKRVSLYGPDSLPLTIRYTDGRFISWAMTPKCSTLAQNFPNPF